MSLVYLLIFGGLYVILFLILIIFWLILARLNFQRKSRGIIFTFAIFLGLLITTAVKPYWYEVFAEFELIIKVEERSVNKKGQLNWHIRPNQLDEMMTGVKQSDQEMYKIGRDLDTSLSAFRILILAYLIQALLSYFVWNGVLWDEEEHESMVPKILRQIATILIFLVALALIISTFYPSFFTGFLATTGAGGAIGALLAQQPIKQAFTALSLNINKPIRKGDFIEMDGLAGTVMDIGWKSIRLVTMENNQLTIPNLTLVNSNYINYSRPDTSRLIEVEITLKTMLPPNKIHQLLTRSASDSSLVKGVPEVSLVQMNNLYSIYLIRVSTTHDYDQVVKNEVLSAIWYMLRREGLQSLPSGYQIENTAEKAIQLINNADILQDLNDEEDAILASKAEFLRFGYPERVLIVGETDSNLFIVAEGNLEVLIRQEDGKFIKVAQLGKNTIFGEMALLTGEPRKATVRALNEVLLLRISKDALKPILMNRPQILEILSDRLAERQLSNEQLSAEYEHETESKKKKGVKDKLLDLMRNFFKEDEESATTIENI
jgi:small-conductance mechanosensitive channel/CRP-like cAMP-binding protein